MSKTKGYFGIGAEGISKPMNMGNLMRSAHAFGASFTFTLNAHTRVKEMTSDTSQSHNTLPFYAWNSLADMTLPDNCTLVAIELCDKAIALPSFRHPRCAAYILGRERGNISQEVLERAAHIVRIPTRFCLNVQIAGAILMYDRLCSLGKFATRPLFGEKQEENARAFAINQNHG